MNVLLVGIGNILRKDDAAGIRAAEEIGRRHRGVDVLIAHGLAPELADTLSDYDTVVFLDATLRSRKANVSSVLPRPWGGDPHALDPEGLLWLTQELCGRVPKRVLLAEIPARDISVGTAMTPFTRRKVQEAVALVEKELRRK